MLAAFAFGQVTVLVRHWFEIGLTDGSLEHGARLELRERVPELHRGSESAAQRLVVDRPIWRADLFDSLGSPSGSYSAAHYHPRFHDNEPCDRVWSEELTADPWGWADTQLANVALLWEGSTPGDAAPGPGIVRAVARHRDQILRTALEFAPERCRTPARCAELTWDIADTVNLMLRTMDHSAHVDRDYLTGWSEALPRR